MPTTKPNTRVQLSFGRDFTDDDLKALQTQTDALEAILVQQAGHHHDHDSVGGFGHTVGDPVFTEE